MKFALFALVVFSFFGAQAAPDDGVLPPARKGLVAVHWPDLTKLEASVREQVTMLQTSLAATVKDPKTTDAALSDAYGNLAQIYHAYSLNSAARECYLNAVSLSPKDFRWVYLLGRLDQHDGRFEDAIGRYRLAGALRPDYVAVAVNLGNLFLELNRLDEASENFKAALAIDKENPATHYGLGQVAMARRRLLASAGLYHAASMAMRMACSWNRGTPRVLCRTRRSSSRSPCSGAGWGKSTT